MTDEQLIELVKQYPVLYDVNFTTYRDHNERNNAWREIARKRKTNVEDVKTKWGKLRNAFTTALKRRRKRIGIPPWKFEKQMSFLLEYVVPRSTASNIDDTIDEESPHELEFQFCDESVRSPPNVPMPEISYFRTSLPRASPSNSEASFHPEGVDDDKNVLKSMLEIPNATQDMSQSTSTSYLDENDHFFLSMCKKLKTLPKTDQAEIKFQLHKLIYESEMNMLKIQ